MSATPRPWLPGQDVLSGPAIITYGPAFTVATFSREADRDLALLAVNSHDELVALLEAMLADDELVLSGGFHDRARAALVKARGEPA